MKKRIDPITLEVIQNALNAIGDELALVIMRTAYSNIVRDSMDYSTAVCDHKGRIIAQGLTTPVHLGSFPDAMGKLMDLYGEDAQPGDVFLFNDPYGAGGMHLPDFYIIRPVFVDNKIVFGYDLGSEGVNVQDVVPAFEATFNLDSSLVGYHAALDHYGLSFGNGNVFEWAKDFTTNDKDIVFVLNPQTFIDAGVDVEAIEGWVFAKVEVMGADGKMTEVEKLLKPFDINGK